MTTDDLTGVHAAWLPPEAFRAIGSRRVLVLGDGALVDTVFDEVARACAGYGGDARRAPAGAAAPSGAAVAGAAEQAGEAGPGAGPGQFDLVLALATAAPLPALAPEAAGAHRRALAHAAGEVGDEGFLLARQGGVTLALAGGATGLLYGLFHLVRLGESAFADDFAVQQHRPVMHRRMLDHWDNVDLHPVMGQVERGYAGGSIFWRNGAARRDFTRVRAYARLLAAAGINAITVNNVNVHATEAHLLTDRLGEVAAIADVLRPYGIRVHLSVNFASPIVLGGLATADPLDEGVRAFWARATQHVYATIPDFGGYVVKADSEGQPGPFAYGRSHADGANVLADALAPYGGVVHWRAFVYNHRQDWRDRTTDRARAAYDNFAPLDGLFRDNAILQVKYGPIDFQTREPVSPVIAAMPNTRLAVELQVTQEYTGQQKHVCYLAPQWSEVLGFRPWDSDGPDVAGIALGETGIDTGKARPGLDGGLVAVSNVGDDRFWTGHPLAQANLYAFCRLAWDPSLDPATILDEWIGLTFPAAGAARGTDIADGTDIAGGAASTGDDSRDGSGNGAQELRRTVHAMMDGSWRTYERYTAPLGVGFMVRPGQHYGPDVDGYEYTPWGTYHFADRYGIGVDRTRATGTGYTGQYPQPWSDRYESLDQCPDELLLFFHHVPYGHVLHSGTTVIQHIYDTHFAGAEQAGEIRTQWTKLVGSELIEPEFYARVAELLDEQVRCAEEWRDQINTYFFRKSGVPDAHGRHIY